MSENRLKTVILRRRLPEILTRLAKSQSVLEQNDFSAAMNVLGWDGHGSYDIPALVAAASDSRIRNAYLGFVGKYHGVVAIQVVPVRQIGQPIPVLATMTLDQRRHKAAELCPDELYDCGVVIHAVRELQGKRVLATLPAIVEASGQELSLTRYRYCLDLLTMLQILHGDEMFGYVFCEKAMDELRVESATVLPVPANTASAQTVIYSWGSARSDETGGGYRTIGF